MASQKQAARPGKPAAGQGRGRAGYLATHKFQLSTLLVSLVGLGVSIYMVIEHYTQNAYAGCPQNATFNCAKVTTSPESVILGIPVAVLGLAFYLFMTGVNSPWGWQSRRAAVHWARLASVVVGIVFVLYLVYAELFLINAICVYCTSVHIITFILFALIVVQATLYGVVPKRDAG